MTWAARIYRGAEFCTFELCESEQAAKDWAGERLADPVREYTHADITHDGVICATIYPLIKENDL